MEDLVWTARDDALSDTPLVLTAGLWDALHRRNVSAYGQAAGQLRGALAERRAPAFWLRTTAVRDSHLQSLEKRQYMNERIVSDYRSEATVLYPSIAAVIDGYAITRPVQERTLDGIHYPEDVGRVLAQVLALVLGAALPRPQDAEHAIGALAEGKDFLGRGVAVLVSVAAMLAVPVACGRLSS